VAAGPVVTALELVKLVLADGGGYLLGSSVSDEIEDNVKEESSLGGAFFFLVVDDTKLPTLAP